jgi:hypothetical protein
MRSEQANAVPEQVLTFRVEQYDEVGNRRDPVLVEMRALHISGRVDDGDEVEVTGRWRRGVLHATRVRTSTGATMSPAGQAQQWIGCIAGFIVFVAFVIFFVAFGIQYWHWTFSPGGRPFWMG